MKKRIWLIAFAAGCVMFLSSCIPPIFGNGKSPNPLPPQVITNKLRIQKEVLPLLPSHANTSPLPYRSNWWPDRDNFNHSIFGDGTIGHCENVIFGNSVYYLGYLYPNQIVFVKSDQLKKIVKTLPAPRRVIAFVAFVVQFESEKYLVVAVKNLRRDNCSLLFILDEKLNTVYEEHAPYAFEIGKYKDERYGECVIVKYGDPYDEDRAKYYMYYLPGKDR